MLYILKIFSTFATYLENKNIYLYFKTEKHEYI